VTRCPTCGADVEVITGLEGTSHYLPRGSPAASSDATNMAVVIRLALKTFGPPEHEPDAKRAMALGALQGALYAHERRIAEAST
jgi:hypothetical protein